MKNTTRSQLEDLEGEVMGMIDRAMYAVLDNGDRPDKRVTAIIGLHGLMKSTLQKLDKITLSIPESM